VERRRRSDRYGVLAKAFLIDGGRWVWWGSVALLLFTSAFKLVEGAGTKQASPFASVQMLDWRLAHPWERAR
jgi:hypothetical protein